MAVARRSYVASRARARTGGPVRSKRETRAASRRGPRYDHGTPAQIEAATARLDPWYVEDDPLAPDAAFYADLDSDVPPTIQDAGKRADATSKPASRRTARTAPPAPVAAPPAVPARLICPRCGRTDWRANGVGLRWHLDNYPACANGRKADHAYIQIGA